MSEHDNLLIAEYHAGRSEDAFAGLVRQHINFVFATAMRQVGDHRAAEEITQNVFVALAQASGKLESHPTIAGWLFQTTLNKSREWLRSELRRHRREQVAVNRELARSEGDSVWSPLVPLLDEALMGLRESDRVAVIMHYMEGQTFHEVGSALGIGEDTARKRVNRCLDELTHFFRRHGFAVPALTAGAPLFALASHAPPAGLAVSVTSAGLAAHSAASTSTTAVIKGALKFMAWTKTKTAIAVGMGLLLATGTATITVSVIREHRTYPWQVADGNSEAGANALNAVPPQVTIVRSKFATDDGEGTLIDDIPPKDQWRYIGTHSPLSLIIERAYWNGEFLSPSQIIMPPDMPGGLYDFIANLPRGSQQALQELIKKKFGLTGRYEMREMDVLLLKVDHPDAPGLKPAQSGQAEARAPVTQGIIHYKNLRLSRLCVSLENELQIPVIDQTGLTGVYDLNFPDLHTFTPSEKSEKIRQVLLDEFGLKLDPGREPVEMLVVEKKK